jgi:DNA-binding response OmpR family regulator
MVTKLLIVEDHEGFTRLLKELLTSERIADLEIRTASSLEEAFREQDVDLVVLDLNLTTSRGLETLKKFRDLDRDTPVIILTGEWIGYQNAFEAGKLSADGFLAKGMIESSESILSNLFCALGRVQAKKDEQKRKINKIDSFIKKLDEIKKEG